MIERGAYLGPDKHHKFGLHVGHSMSNQHAKWTPVTDFAETW